MIAEPTLSDDIGGSERVLWWRLEAGTACLSSASVGGGTAQPSWVTNVQVPLTYDRTDLAQHAAEIQAALGLDGDGVTLFTATDIRRKARAVSEQVSVDVTAGITKPTYAASSDSGWSTWSPGTINVVAHLPVCLTAAAAVNAVITMTEAKTQALYDLKIPGTGTASDAVVVLWNEIDDEVVSFTGPRAEWGARLARATYEAVELSARTAMTELGL